MNDREWLDSLKVGDPVAVVSHGAYRGARLATIDAIHKLHFIVRGSRFRRYSGQSTGDSYSGSALCKPDDPYAVKEIAASECRRLRDAINSAMGKCEDTEKLRAAFAALTTKPAPSGGR